MPQEPSRFGLIGWFFVRAAFAADPKQAQDLAQALRAFADGPDGQIWLGAIGLGFLCYGAYCFTNARFRYIPSCHEPPEPTWRAQVTILPTPLQLAMIAASLGAAAVIAALMLGGNLSAEKLILWDHICW